MLDQLVYTRCSPHRELKNGGQVVRADGFGVFSMSEELLSNKKISSYDFLQGRLAIQNGAKENSQVGLFNSYEYLMVAPGVYALTFEVARPLCKIPRANGKSHRSGTYIKQCLLGEIKGYPFEWFGASAWDAHKKSENDYYLDSDPNPVPAFLPQTDSVPVNGYINTAQVKAFIDDGRAEAVKAGIWFLLREFEKPEAERKVLVIKDTPDNVELWIAAIECGFSASMAQKITFATNRSKLSTQSDRALFYYTDEAGRFYPMLNRSVAQIRHPYCMIVGFHPKDDFCSNLRQMSTSNFVILDGTTKTTGFQPDKEVCKPYYTAVTQCNEDIQDFCKVVLPSIPVNGLVNNLPELYDAYKYLLDSNHKSEVWNYSDAANNMDTFMQYGMPTAAAIRVYLIDECLSCYPRFCVEDERNGYKFLKYMWSLAQATGKEHDVTGCIAKIVSDELATINDGSNIIRTWNSLKNINAVSMLQPALPELFSDERLSVYIKQLKGCDAASAKTVSDMFMWMLSVNQYGITYVSQSNVRFTFSCMTIIAMMNDQKCMNEVLNQYKQAPALFVSMILSVTQYLEKYESTKTYSWWNNLIENIFDGNVLDLCIKLCQSKSVTMETIERILVNRIVCCGGVDADIIDAFCESTKRLGKRADTGKRLLNEWVKTAKPNEFITIIRFVKECDLSRQVEIETFDLMDKKLPYDAENSKGPTIYDAMQRWANELNTVSKSAAFYWFKQKFIQVSVVEEAIALANEFAAKKITANESLLNSKSFSEVAAKSAEFCNANLHLALLCLFEKIENTTTEKYVESYATMILDATRGRDMVRQMVSLCEAAMYGFKVQERTVAFIGDIQKQLDNTISQQIVRFYKPTMIEQVYKYKGCDDEVKERLVSKINDAKKSAGTKGIDRFSKGIGDILNGLFGKK